MNVSTLIPAYGRDYNSGKAARLDFARGKDFIIADMSSPWDGKPTGRGDFVTSGQTTVGLRFNRLQGYCVATVADTVESIDRPKGKRTS